MTNPFRDQSKFMRACDQTTDVWNEDQFNLYVNLIEEEFKELKEAIAAGDKVEILDALEDIMVVTAGAMHSAGFDGEGGWKEVMRSNFSKIGEDGKVRKREDGKVLKPTGYSPPDLKPYVKKN
jgi:predicted HAD superfamily Cof-like phosphohydrolase